MIASSRQFVSSFPVSSVLEAIVLGASRALFMRFLSTAKSSSSRTIASLYATGGAEGGEAVQKSGCGCGCGCGSSCAWGSMLGCPLSRRSRPRSAYPLQQRSLPRSAAHPVVGPASIHGGSFGSTLSKTALGSDLSNSLVPRPNLNHGDHPMRDIAG